MRLFLAIRLPEDAMGRACEVQEALRERITRQGVRFTAPHKMHLTLAFLGNDLEPEEAHRVAAATLAGRRALHLELAGLGAFPHMERPKTIWLAVQGEGLGELAAQLARAFALGDAPFVGHVTLARVSPASKAVGWLLREYVRELRAPSQPIDWLASEVELIASLPGGEYETLQRYSL
jgi:2'-5' RNA ligase